MMAIAQSSLALLFVVATASNGFADAANLRSRNLGGTTIATNVKTYTAYGDYASAMLAAVNKQRATGGLKPLCLNKKLHAAAQRHSDDMAAKDYMAHDGSDGSTMSERITQAGYDWSAVAENVAAGQVDVADVMVAWINSPEHLENIMGDYTMFGSAYAFNKAGTYQHYWTQDFGSGDAEECDSATPAQKTPVTPAPTTMAPATEAPTPAPTTADETQQQQEAPVTPAPTTGEEVQGESETPQQQETPVTPAPSAPATDCESNF
ncbi:SCP-like extracellular protein [Phytophthora cinnamomi]|uniref:SCP-like extracellular protein n=1 Tax=Phytophthora cinnamomi TaxID=4785 RepID=UPI00355972B9|nr:SCP-like extracellular protein [Phytophthora cinnamomi]